MRKKFLALLLAFVMVVGMLPMAALADEAVDAGQTDANVPAQTETGGTETGGDSQTGAGDGAPAEGGETGGTSTDDTNTGNTDATTSFSLEGSKVEEITKTATITGNGTANVTISVNPESKLVWYPSDNGIGRGYNGWWIGIKVNAPTTLPADESNAIKATYYNSNGSTLSESKKFSEHKDGDNYMQLWGGIPDENFLDPVFKATGGKYTLTYTWYFNWDGNENTGNKITVGNNEAKGIDQTVKLSFDLSKCQLLAKPSDASKPGIGSEEQIWPRAVNFTVTTSDNKVTYYETLPEAVAAAATGSTIEMQQDVEGPGVKLLSSAQKTLTIDFGGKTYTCADPGAGSTGTESQGFHLEKGNAVTLKNGTIAVKQGVNDTRTLIQNYSKLNLESITLDGTNLHQALYNGVVFPQNATFTLNSYNDKVTLTDVTILNSKNSNTAYSIGCGWWPGTSNDSYKWYPDGTQITVNAGSTFENVLLYRDDANQTSSNVTDAKSTITLGNNTYALKYEDETSPYYVEFAKSGNTLTPVLPEATVNYTALLDTAIVPDCADKTMWVQFAEALPGNTWLWFEIKGKDAGAPTYGIAAQAKNDGTTTKFAWSFLNQGQFEMWPTSVTGVASGDYTVTCSLLPGKVSGTQTQAPTGWVLWTKDVTVADLTPATAAPVVTLPEGAKVPEDKVDEVKAAAANVALPDSAMNTLANDAYEAVASNPPTADEAKDALTKAGITVNDRDTVNLVVQTYMDVAVTEYTPASGDTPATLTYDITPMYRVVATTETNPDGIAVKGDSGVDNNDANAAIVVEGKKLTVRHSVDVTVGLPTGFVAAADGSPATYPNVYVQHKGHEYTASVSEGVAPSGGGTKPLLATFTNPHGFSTFTITAASTAVAKIGDDSYTSLQDAVNEVQKDGTIKVLKNGLTATVDREIVFTIELDTNVTEPTINVDSDYDLKITNEGGNKKYTVTKKTNGGNTGDNTGDSGSTYVPVGPGGGIGGVGYVVSLPSNIENGTVRVSPSNASEGVKVTITATPDEGYVVGSVIVTDKDGNEIEVTDAGDGKYTFTMPNGKVDVAVEFVEEQPANAVEFVDVDSDAWYADAVNWAVSKGITVGTGDGTTFSPNAPCTRAQIVTFLWRAAGSPEATGSNPFTDVAEDAYYYDAVLWAVENEITVGTGDGTTFSPDEVCTRSEVVTFLWRYEGNPEATASNAFTDVADSDWFSGAVLWAVENEITVGTGDGTTFSPSNDCTRAEIVTFLYRDMAE